jgi:protein phosphatase methylesterase 1
MLPDAFDVGEEEEETDGFAELPVERPDDDSSSASSASSTGTIRPTISKNLFVRPNGCVLPVSWEIFLTLSRTPNKNSMVQIPWTVYFERELNLKVTDNSTTITHHVYLTSPTGSAPLFVTHHGAGSSGLSFAALTAQIRKLLPGAGILSLDARSHGSTTITSSQGNASDGDLDLSLETLSADLVTVIGETKAAMSWPTTPPLILIGHSLGGAVVTDVAMSGKLGDRVLGYAVLDVVEGSAIDALQSMQTYLSTRPVGFPTLESGIDWHIRSRTIRNSLSARASVPALLRYEKDPSRGKSRPWTWRTDLAATQPFWEGWFVGLSRKFLEARGGKLLLLAGTDRLDKELIIGQMQGMFFSTPRLITYHLPVPIPETHSQF